MNAVILPYDFPSDELTVFPVNLTASIVKYCKKHNVTKVLVERPDPISTKSFSAKPVVQVNVDAFTKLLISKGVATVTFTLTQQLGKSMTDLILNYERQLAEVINQNRYDNETILILVETQRSGKRPNVFGKKPSSPIPELLKPNGIKLDYIQLSEL